MDGTVQVCGSPVTGKIQSVDDGSGIRFWLRDASGQEAPILYRGQRPDGLEQAESVIAIGQYQNNYFVAEKLLVKCPSKYQGGAKK